MRYRVGQTFYYEGYLNHIVAVLKDKFTEEVVVVYRYYGKTKQWWHYGVITTTALDAQFENDTAWLKRKK